MTKEQQAVAYRFLLAFGLGMLVALEPVVQSGAPLDWRVVGGVVIAAALAAAEKTWALSLGPVAPAIKAHAPPEPKPPGG